MKRYRMTASFDVTNMKHFMEGEEAVVFKEKV